MLKKETIPLSVQQLLQMDEKGKLNFDIAIQRKGKIWDVHRKSLLIVTLIEGYPIPNIYTKKENDIYSFIDGKQRLTTILEFLQDGFALSPKTPKVNDVDDVVGLKFSDLNEEFKKNILKTSLSITKFEKISDEQIEKLFARLNNGVPLKAIESIRVLLGTENIHLLQKISEHPFFMEKASISKNRYTEQEIVLQLLMSLKNNETGFSSKELKDYVESYRKSPIEKDLIDALIAKLDYLNHGFTQKEKFLKKVHLPIILAMIDKAIEKGITPEYFALWLKEFFTTLDKESVYFLASQSGSAKKENVQIRLKYMAEKFETTFDVYKYKEESTGAEQQTDTEQQPSDTEEKTDTKEN